MSKIDVSASPLVIEAAISSVVANAGGTVLTTENIIEQGKSCIEAGAGIIHYHHNFSQTREESIAQCVAVQKGILDAYPGTLIYPGFLPTGTPEEKMLGHLPALREAGVLKMFAFDPGVNTHGRPDADGLPSTSIAGGSTYEEATRMAAYSCEVNVPTSIGIFEPGALRWVRTFGAAGKFTPGSIVKFYFAGNQAWGSKGAGATFGLPPSKEALAIYLSLIEGSGLTWIVSILGGTIMETDLPRYVLERGGHLRLGIEDPLREVETSNAEMVRSLVKLAGEVGRPVATYRNALEVLSASTL